MTEIRHRESRQVGAWRSIFTTAFADSAWIAASLCSSQWRGMHKAVWHWLDTRWQDVTKLFWIFRL